jgi:hypothetical protein
MVVSWKAPERSAGLPFYGRFIVGTSNRWRRSREWPWSSPASLAPSRTWKYGPRAATVYLGELVAVSKGLSE